MAVLPNAAKNAALDALAGLFDNASLHDDYPGSTGNDNELTGGTPAYARKAITWSAASGGVLDSSNTPQFDVPASSEVAWVGFWDTTTWSGGIPLTDGATWEAFTGSASTDILTVPDHTLSEDDEVTVVEVAGESLPTGLSVGGKYYVIADTADTVKLEASLGGGAIDLTADGVGMIVKVARETFASQGTLTLSDADVGL